MFTLRLFFYVDNCTRKLKLETPTKNTIINYFLIMMIENIGHMLDKKHSKKIQSELAFGTVLAFFNFDGAEIATVSGLTKIT